MQNQWFLFRIVFTVDIEMISDCICQICYKCFLCLLYK